MPPAEALRADRALARASEDICMCIGIKQKKIYIYIYIYNLYLYYTYMYLCVYVLLILAARALQGNLKKALLHGALELREDRSSRQ